MYTGGGGNLPYGRLFSDLVTKLSNLLVILCRDLLYYIFIIIILYYCIFIILYIIIVGWNSIIKERVK